MEHVIKAWEQQAKNQNNPQGKAQISRRGLRVITIASGKGGVGKSSLCVNLAIALSQLGQRVLVMDADFGLANVDVMLGTHAKYNFTHFLRGEKSISEIIQIGYDGVRFISGGSGVSDLLSMSEEQLEKIMRGITRIDMPVDFILYDAGAGINETIFQLAVSSSETIVVTTPEPTAVLGAYSLVKNLVRRDNTLSISIVVNRAESPKEAERVISGFEDAISTHLNKSVNRLGSIAMDSELPRSIKRQTPLMVSSPESKYARDVRMIARTILDLPQQEERQGLLSRMFSRFTGR